MNPVLEGFLDWAKYNTSYKFPDVITKENVNAVYGPRSILDAAVMEGAMDEVNLLIQMGAKIQSKSTLRTCNSKFIELILETGVTSNQTRECFEDAINSTKSKRCKLLVDYGVKVPMVWNHRVSYTDSMEIELYATLSNARLLECRKALLALLWCCERVLRPIRGVILQMATQVWRLKGGEGAGPRAHGWK